MKKKNKVERLREMFEDPVARDMIEHTDEIAGHLTGRWKKCKQLDNAITDLEKIINKLKRDFLILLILVIILFTVTLLRFVTG